MICDYGCGQKAKHQFKNGKWCCSESFNMCPFIKKIISKNSKEMWLQDGFREKFIKSKIGEKNHFYNKKHSKNTKKILSEKRKGKTYEEIYGKEKAIEIKNKRKNKSYEEIYGKEKSKKIKLKQSKSHKNNNRRYRKINIEYINEKYLFFSQVEEMRYNPDKPEEKEIQVRCKNHLCSNSKEKGGWFIPTKTQIYERIRQLENENGNDGNYFYCCDQCKEQCPLYKSKGSDPFKSIKRNYKANEYQQFREHVLKRDNYECQYCGDPAEHVHHERPQTLEPFFSLDPDLAWSTCKKCHYEKGHKDYCSSMKLFLNKSNICI